MYAHNGVHKSFLGTRHSLLSQLLTSLYPNSVSILWRTFICISACLEIVYELPLLPNSNGIGTYLHKPGAVRNVNWIFITGAQAWRWLGEYVTLDKTFLQSSFQTVSIISVSYLQIFFLAVFFEVFIRNVINMLCKKYVIVIWINENNAVINNNNNNCRRLFKIPTGTRKDFFDSFKQFRHAPS
jgi:hypothetical protein